MKPLFKVGDKVVCESFAYMPWKWLFDYDRRPHLDALYEVTYVHPSGRISLKDRPIAWRMNDEECGWNSNKFKLANTQ